MKTFLGLLLLSIAVFAAEESTRIPLINEVVDKVLARFNETLKSTQIELDNLSEGGTVVCQGSVLKDLYIKRRWGLARYFVQSSSLYDALITANFTITSPIHVVYPCINLTNGEDVGSLTASMNFGYGTLGLDMHQVGDDACDSLRLTELRLEEAIFYNVIVPFETDVEKTNHWISDLRQQVVRDISEYFLDHHSGEFSDVRPCRISRGQ